MQKQQAEPEYYVQLTFGQWLAVTALAGGFLSGATGAMMSLWHHPLEPPLFGFAVSFSFSAPAMVVTWWNKRKARRSTSREFGSWLNWRQRTLSSMDLGSGEDVRRRDFDLKYYHASDPRMERDDEFPQYWPKQIYR